MHSKTTIAVFCLLLGGLGLLNLAAPSKQFSENENRYLKQMPKLSTPALLDGSFMKDFDAYVIDQFILRDSWVGMKTLAERSLGKSSSGGVYFARDGFLLEMFDSVGREQYAKNLAYVRDFSRYAAENHEVQANTILVPTAALPLEDKLPAFAPEVDQAALLRQAAQSIPGFVDVSNSLLAHHDEYIYYRTDHHWTTLGAFYAYNDWRTQTGDPAKGLDQFDQETLSDRFYGTTYTKASLYTAKPDTITAFIAKAGGTITVDYNAGALVSDSVYEPSYLSKRDKYSVFLNANQPTVHIATGQQNGRRLLLVKDSYANTFVQMLLDDYEEIFVIDLRYFKASVRDYIAEKEITDSLILYSLKGFADDANLFLLSR